MFAVETKMFLGSSSGRPNVSRPWVISGISDLVTVDHNERIGRPTLTGEKALTLMMEVIATKTGF